MSVTTENAPVQGQTTLQENRAGEGVYASLFEKINLTPASRLGDINDFLDDAALSEAPAAERLTAAMQVFMERIRQSGQRVEKLDKTLIDHHIAELDFQISRQLAARRPDPAANRHLLADAPPGAGLGSLARAVFPQRPGVSGNFPIVAGLFVLEQRYRHHWRHAGRNLHPHHPSLRRGVEHPLPAYSTAGLASV